MMNYLKKLSRLILGLFLFAFGSYLSIQANVGLAPWDAFSMGFSMISGISFGNIVVLAGFVILGFDLLLKEKVGIGTLINIILIGKFVDMLQWIDVFPMITNFGVGIVMLILGQFSIAFGSYLYIGAALGCGPRDALMVALGKRLDTLPIGLIRGIIEGSALLIGWVLGAKVGIGTVIAMFGISIIIQFVFKILKFDVKSVKHEDVAQTTKEFLTILNKH
ncbi:MAG: hypothetical protein JJE03_06990 [Peptostreptococcaceae bacterium]|nr:hypothetical protein [Peptostreptococcaceae bacterium]